MQALTRLYSLVAAVILVMVSATSSSAQEQKEASLYERLGGIHAIATVVDDFVERIWVNEVLNANPKNKQAMGLPKPALKYLVTELMGQATGGPQKYTGRPLKETHQGLNISEKEWDAMIADLKTTLDKFEVPKKEQEEIFAIVNSTKPDIVMASK